MGTQYIDFETLGSRAGASSTSRAAQAHPVLLGVLSDAGAFTQFILDPRLTRAAVARKSLVAADLGRAIDRILDTPGQVVSWSSFDAQVIEAAADVSSSAKREFAARYVNARTVAKKWRGKVRPSIDLPEEDGRDLHELKAYMRAVGVRVPRALGAGQAVKWMKHVSARVEGADGYYRRINDTAKRDWHRLLEYNRLDCAGLKAVHERASNELRLWGEYLKTSFIVLARGAGTIKMGWKPGWLLKRLEGAGARSWAFMTAYNPASTPLPESENRVRNEALRAELDRRYVVLAGEGRGEDASWTPEPSLLVLGISRNRAVALGRKYGQLAIVFGTCEEGAALVPCEPPIATD